MDNIKVRDTGHRYEPEDLGIRTHGIGESRTLDFHSPYGCSKGCADQYVLDYARMYKLPMLVFRMSCIYGPHQFGSEDQGWVAHFVLQLLRNKPITIFGDGKQVRDVLYVEDLVDALLLARKHINLLQGKPYNIGGGVANTLNLQELLVMLKQVHGKLPQVRYGNWRPGDQRYYVSDIRRFSQATGWQPKYAVNEGIAFLYQWLHDFHELTESPAAPLHYREIAMPPMAMEGV